MQAASDPLQKLFREHGFCWRQAVRPPEQRLQKPQFAPRVQLSQDMLPAQGAAR